MPSLNPHWKGPLVLVGLCAAGFLACKADSGDGGGDVGPSKHDWPPSGDDGDRTGHGDGDGDPNDAKPICDLSQFPKLTPEWIAVVESPHEGETPTVGSLVVTADALFASGPNNLAGTTTGFVERRSLSGELEWALQYDNTAGFALAWDGEHLYGAGGGRIRRWTVDGLEDAWVYDGGSSSIADLVVGEDSVAIVGHFDEPGGYEDGWLDAYYGTVSKAVPAVLNGYDTHAFEIADDVGSSVVRSPWGGWIAAGSVSDPDGAWLRGFAGSNFSADLHPYEYSHVTTMIPHDDELLVVGWSNFAPSGVWMGALSSSGQEKWLRELWICEGVGAALDEVAERDGKLWGIGAVRTAPDTYSPILVRMSFDGAVEQVSGIDTAPERDVMLYDMATYGDEMYFGGFWYTNTPGHRVIGKVKP